MVEFILTSTISFQCWKLQSNLMYQNVMFSSLEMEETQGLLVEVCSLKLDPLYDDEFLVSLCSLT